MHKNKYHDTNIEDKKFLVTGGAGFIGYLTENKYFIRLFEERA